MKIFPELYFRKGPINNEPALIRGMARRRVGDNPIPKPMTTQFNAKFQNNRTIINTELSRRFEILRDRMKWCLILV